MRHIKLRGRWEPTLKKVVVTVLDRPTDDYLFGNRDGESEEFFFGSKCCLVSDKYAGTITSPEINRVDSLLDVGIGDTGAQFHCLLGQWELIKDAVKEFNAWGGGYETP